MITANNRNYDQDDRNFYHPEDDIRSTSDNNSTTDTYNPEESESYVDEYERENADDQQIVSQSNDISNNENDLDEQFSNSLERDGDDWDEGEDDLDDIDEDIDPDDMDDDLEEDYDENDREIDSFATDQLKRNENDQEFDIDQDLEEIDPVNNPRKF